MKNTGNDSNSGLSDAQAWAHHPWMITWTGNVTLRPGDIVCMNRGDKWTIANPSSPYMIIGQSGNSVNYIKTTAYGTGAKPVISISTETEQNVIFGEGISYLIFDNLEISHWNSVSKAWTNYIGIHFTNYGDKVVHDCIITNCDFHDIPSTAINIGDAYNIIIGDTTAVSTATSSNYSNHIYNIGFAGIVMGGVNPTDKNSNFYVFKNYIHDVNINGIDTDNAYGITFSSNKEATNETRYCYARFNLIEDIPTWTGIDAHNGQHIFFQDNYIKNCKYGIALGPQDKGGLWDPINNYGYIERNIIENSGNHPLSSYGPISIGDYSLEVTTNTFVRDNIIFYTTRPSNEVSAYGIFARGVNGITISGNKIYNGPVPSCNGGIWIGYSSVNVTISGNYINNWRNGITIAAPNKMENISIHENIVHSHGICIGTEGTYSINGYLNIYNNIFVVTPSQGYCYPINLDKLIIPISATFNIKNNIIGFTTSYSNEYILIPERISGTFNCDYNLYWNSSYANAFGHISWSAWNSRGYDIHSLNNTDPLFKNASGSYSQDLDFNIQTSSPAINTGTDVGLTTDYVGNTIFGLPDIGAFENQPVIIPGPTYTGSIIQNATPSLIEMTYDLTMANIVPATSAFSAQVNSNSRSISSVSISGKKVLLSLSYPIAYGDQVTIAYTKPSSNPLQTSAGGQAASMTAQNVVNNVAPPSVPVYISSAIENAAPSVLEITYSLILANIVPAVSAFSVQVNSVARAINSVSVSGTKVLLTLASPVVYGNVVTVAYTLPSANPLQTPAGGKVASIGAQSVTNRINAPPSVPVYVSSSVENSAPAVIEMTYNLTLANIVPAVSAFSVQVNSVAKAVNTVSVSGTKVLLTLSSSVVYGNVISVAYSVPSTNPLQTSTGGKAASFAAQSVTNRVSPTASPVYMSSAVENTTPSVIEMTYNLSLANVVPASSAFSVQVNSTARTVNSVSVSATKVLLTLSIPVSSGNIITVAYTSPSSNPLQTSTGVKAASFTAQPVTNRINPPANPVYLSSAVENTAPSVIEITYNLNLASIVPMVSAFNVVVNSVGRNISSVTISGAKVFLTLSAPVIYGDIITVAYSKPSSNPLQTPGGGQAVSIISQPVTNKTLIINTPPVIVVNYQSSSYSGFVCELNASGSYDKNKDNLTYTWIAPGTVPVSSMTGSVIKYLGPSVSSAQIVEFTLKVSDGKATQSKVIPVEIQPYQPELEEGEVIKVEASNFQSPYNPSNIIDDNIGTMWAANGANEWLIIELKHSFEIQYVKLAFDPGQKRESYFDVMGSTDKENWEPILTKSLSCAFSSDLQVFDFPASKTEREFKYVKLVGNGNSIDSWNHIAEFRVFGYKHKDPSNYEEQIVKIFPNPASESINIRIEEPTVSFDYIRIIHLSGKTVYLNKVDQGVREFQIPISLTNGIYLIQLGIGDITIFTQKLIVDN